MLKAFQKLRPIDWMVVALGLGFVAALQFSPVSDVPTPNRDVTPNQTPENIQLLRFSGPVPVPGTESAKAYANFLAATKYIGAFALNESGAFGWASGYNSLDMAKEVAQFRCAKHGVKGCQIIAVLLPQKPVDRDGIVFSRSTQRGYDEHMAQPGFRAFAASESGTWGSAWGYQNPIEARARAMSNCQTYLQRQIDNGFPVRPCRFVK